MKYLQPTPEQEIQTSGNESGRIGYVIAWLLGVPASMLFFVFLVRGH
jgi:hypothetical protein